MTDTKHSNRIPFEDINSSAAWDFPSWDDGAKVVASVKKKNPAAEEAAPGRMEDVEQDEQQNIAPITAAQLQQITEEAEREGREHGYTQGYEQGFAEGEKKGTKLGEQKAYTEIKARLDEQRDRFCQLADALLDPVSMQDGELENLVLDMAVHFAKHLLNKELNEDPSGLFDVVKRAAASLPAGAQNIRVYVHADDVELAHEAFSARGLDWRFYGDSQLSRGGCRIESNESLIDYSVEHRLQQMLDEVNYQGEVDVDSVPPVADYRPPADLEDEAETAAETEATAVAPAQEEPAMPSSEFVSPVEQSAPVTENSAPQEPGQNTPPGEQQQGESPAPTEPAHPFGNPWDGRRE